MPDHGRVEPTASPGPSVLPCGDRALLVEVPDAGGVAAVRAALERSPLPGQCELVPAARTVLVVLDRPPSELDVAALRRLPVESAPDDRPGPVVELPVVFDGPDLAEVARLTGRAVPDLVAALTGAELTVAFGGFAPGFGYLTGLPRTCTCRGGPPPGRVSRRARWASPGRSPVRIRGPHPVAGSWSAGPTPSCSTSTGIRPRCSCRVSGCACARWAEC